MSLKIEGIEAVQSEIKSLGKDKIKRREILKILRRQAKPMMQAMRQKAPQSDNVIIVRDNLYYPGNLKKSIAIKTSPSKKYPNVLVGPRYGKGAKKYDGFYAWWIEYASGTQASTQLKKYIDKKAKTLKL